MKSFFEGDKGRLYTEPLTTGTCFTLLGHSHVERDAANHMHLASDTTQQYIRAMFCCFMGYTV